MHDLLLQKSDGTFALVVWGERLKGTDEVTIRLGESYPTLRVYDPTLGVKPFRSLEGADRLKLSLGDHPLVVEIGRK